MKTPLYILDTSVMILLLRGTDLGKRIDSACGLSKLRDRPLASIVSHGELRSFARQQNWGVKKLDAVQKMLDDGLVTVDISRQEIIDAYVEVDLFSKKHPDGSRVIGKNDLWIGATALVTQATLLTTDQHFKHFAPDLFPVTCFDIQSSGS